MPPLTKRHAMALAEVYADPAVARYIGGAAVVHPDNAPSRGRATRLGFRVHREDVTPAGVPVLVHERLAQPGGRTSRPIARWASGA